MMVAGALHRALTGHTAAAARQHTRPVWRDHARLTSPLLTQIHYNVRVKATVVVTRKRAGVVQQLEHVNVQPSS